jgi:hypothetical protein
VLLQAQHFFLDVNLDLTAVKFNPNVDPERTINTNFRDDDPFNPVRAKLFPTFEFNETFAIEGDFLFDNKAKRFDRTKGNQQFRMDGLFLAVKGLADNRLNFWFGKIPTPVGTFSPRSYSHTNPLIGWPLAYSYKVPYNVFALTSEAGNLRLRGNNVGAGTVIYEACWINGVSVFGEFDNFEYMIDVGRGTLTNPEAIENKGFQIAGRVGYKFDKQYAVGFSAGIAPYLQHEPPPTSGIGIRDPKHFIGGIDASAHFEKFHLFVEAFYNSWDTPQYQNEKSVQAYSWYVEGQYFLFPNFYAATRFDQMLYNDITDPATGLKIPWGYDVTRIEGGIGYKPINELNLKAVIQQNYLDHPTSKSITIVAMQAAFRFEDVQSLVGLEKRKPAYTE